MVNAASFMDYFFPLEAPEYKPPEEQKKEHKGNWFYVKCMEAYDLLVDAHQFQQQTYLISQTFIVVCDALLVLDRAFQSFPKPIGRVAQLGLNGLGIMYVDVILADIFKTVMDTGTSLMRKDIGTSFYLMVKSATKVVDLFLLFGVCSISSLNVFGYTDLYKRFYDFIYPYSLTSFLVGFSIKIGDLALGTKLYHELDMYRLSLDLDGISESYNTFLKDFTQTVLSQNSKENKNDAFNVKSAKRIINYIRDVDFIADFKTVLPHWKEGQDLSKNELRVVKKYFIEKVKPKIEQLDAKKDIKIEDLKGHISSLEKFDTALHDAFSMLMKPKDPSTAKAENNELAVRTIKHLHLQNQEAIDVLTEKLPTWKPGEAFTVEEREKARKIYKKFIKPKLEELDSKHAEKLAEISYYFCTLMLHPTHDALFDPKSSLANRIIIQLGQFDYLGIRQGIHAGLNGWIPGQQFTEEQKRTATTLFKTSLIPAIERQLWHKSSSFVLSMIGYAGMAIDKFVPNTLTQAITDTFLGTLHWINGYTYYVQSKQRAT